MGTTPTNSVLLDEPNGDQAMMPIMRLKDRDVYAIARYPHPGDSHLAIVLCRWHDKFVTWIYNSQVEDFGHGEYMEPSTTLGQALASFHGRYTKVLGRHFIDYDPSQTAGGGGNDDDPKYWNTPW